MYYYHHRLRHQNPSYHRHRNPSYHHLRHQNPSYNRHHRQHQNPSCDQIPHHQHLRNRFYDQIEAPRCAASNPTTTTSTGLPVAEVKPTPKAPVVDFPLDVLIQILARLPAKSLLKFRCVCKSWNSLIQQDRHFLSLHQLHLNDNKKPPPLVSFHHEGFYSIINYTSSSSDSTPYKIISNPFNDPHHSITNSCNGLLGLYSSSDFYVVNPTIRKQRPLLWKQLTRPWSFSTAALGFDASTGVHKVVRIFDHRNKAGSMPDRLGCEVYYLGGSGGWKLIDDPPVRPSIVSLPVVVDRAVLWASEKEHLEVVALSFDLREEKFSVIMHPEGSSRRHTFHHTHVFSSGGCICFAEERESPADTSVLHMDIWLLTKDDKNNNSKWVKQYVFDLTCVLQQMGSSFRAQPLTTDHNGRIVISWGRRPGTKEYYDPPPVKHDDFAHVAPYTESMVWPWP